MQKLILVALLAVFTAAVRAQPIKFLEEKTAFCYSQNALAIYLNHAEQRNLDGLNKLVLAGKCGFVPDGEVVRLTKYKTGAIGDTRIIRFRMNNNTYWTFQALVQTADFGNF